MTQDPYSIERIPDAVTLILDNDAKTLKGASVVSYQDITIRFEERDGGLAVSLQADSSPVCFVKLRWNIPLPKEARFSGGAWERGYGDLEWRCVIPERMFPWFCYMTWAENTAAYGVKTLPRALCNFRTDEGGITLFLDVRCGGSGVLLKGRNLEAATILSRPYAGISPFEAASRFCGEMCREAIFPTRPVYGSNNWYYAYGDSSHDQILKDTDYLASLTKGLDNPPFMVIDDGWQEPHVVGGYNGGPWRTGNAKFPDMGDLAAGIRERGAKPGIWVRFLTNQDPSIPDNWRLSRENTYLDPSHPGVLDYIQEDIRTITGWGYELIKHDYSTWDIFGRWGMEMITDVTTGGWRFYDTSRTTAEIITAFYRIIHETAQGALIIGCNTIGHLGTGLMELNRTGDDTSGYIWEKTRRLGVNTIAYTLPLHKKFFDIDADCVGITGEIPWEMNRQWLSLLAQSGTPLFVSAKPGVLNDRQNAELAAAYARASVQQDQAEPLDWLNTVYPSEWRINGETVRFDWYEKY